MYVRYFNDIYFYYIHFSAYISNGNYTYVILLIIFRCFKNKKNLTQNGFDPYKCDFRV